MRLRAAAGARIDAVASIAERGLRNLCPTEGSVSQFRQRATLSTRTSASHHARTFTVRLAYIPGAVPPGSSRTVNVHAVGVNRDGFRACLTASRGLG